MSFHQLLGVRDQAHAIFRLHMRAKLVEEPILPKCMDKDMDDMFWGIPRDLVVSALEWAHKTLKGATGNVWFSIAKGGQGHIDRIG